VSSYVQGQVIDTDEAVDLHDLRFDVVQTVDLNPMPRRGLGHVATHDDISVGLLGPNADIARFG